MPGGPARSRVVRAAAGRLAGPGARRGAASSDAGSRRTRRPTPTYTPPEQTYTPPPSRPRGPTPADPGTAGADLVHGQRRAPRGPDPEAAGRARAGRDARAGDRARAGPGVHAGADRDGRDAARDASPPRRSTPGRHRRPASPETPVASVARDAGRLDARHRAVPRRPPQPVDGRSDGSGIPIDGAGLLVALLACGVVLAVRAFRHGQRRLAIPLAAFCVAYLVVVGGVFAGVANATPVPDFEAAPGDGEVLLTWTPLDDRRPCACSRLHHARSRTARTPAARVVPLMTEASALDSALDERRDGALRRVRRRRGGRRLDTSATPTAGVDGEAPPPVTGLRVNSENARVRVRWTPPAVEDLAEIVVVRRLGARAPRTPKDGTVVYRGLARDGHRLPGLAPRARLVRGLRARRRRQRLDAGDRLAAALRPAALRPARRRRRSAARSSSAGAAWPGRRTTTCRSGAAPRPRRSSRRGRTRRATCCGASSPRAATPGTCSPASGPARWPATAPCSARGTFVVR